MSQETITKLIRWDIWLGVHGIVSDCITFYVAQQLNKMARGPRYGF